MTFDGKTALPQDTARLRGQLALVQSLMADHCWRTLASIAEAVDAPEGSISARLRDLRKPRFGGYIVERKRHGAIPGCYLYRVMPAPPQAQLELPR